MSGLKEKVTTASIAIHTLDTTARPHTIHLEVSITEESLKILGKSFGPYVLFRKRKIRESVVVVVNSVFVLNSILFLVNGFFNKYFLSFMYYWYPFFFFFLFSDLFFFL